MYAPDGASEAPSLLSTGTNLGFLLEAAGRGFPGFFSSESIAAIARFNAVYDGATPALMSC